MKRLRLLWDRVLSSYWFIPSLLTLLGAGLATLTVNVDRTSSVAADDLWLVFGVGAEGARGVLSAIAGSVITVTGVVFSITVVALQLASQQFTPRVLRTFASDRAGHLVLGTLIGTFTYALLVERTVRSESEDLERFVPSISLTVAVGLALLSVAALIYFVHHTAHAIRSSTIIARVTDDVHDLIDRLYPEELGEPAEEAVAFPSSETPGLEVPSTRSGYVQLVEEDTLFELAESEDLRIRLVPQVGDFVLEGEPLASVWIQGAGGDPREIRRRINDAFILGTERTLRSDVRRGMLELVEIAVKALSPGINDPTTAVQSIDRLAELVARLGRRRFPPAARAGDDGVPRIYAPRQEFDRLAELAFDQVRHYAAGTPAVMLHLLDALLRVGRLLPPERRAALRDLAKRIGEDAESRIDAPIDSQRVHRAAESVLARL